MVFDPNAKIELTCPNCGGKWDEKLGDLRAGPVRCPGCDLEIDTREFTEGMSGAEQTLKRFGRRNR
jgi:hypothetical protein